MTQEPTNPPAKSIDEYLASVPEIDRVALQELRTIIRAAAPEASEGISYRIPAFTWNGPLVFFAAFKNHLGLYVVSSSILKQFSKELESYKVSGTTIRFTAKNPLPRSLIVSIINARMQENEQRIRDKQSDGQQYIALLRGINVGGHAPIKMTDLKTAFEAGGFDHIRTILTSGNIIFESRETDESTLSGTIELLLKNTFSYDIPVILRRMKDLGTIKKTDPFKDIVITPDIRLNVTFYSDRKSPKTISLPYTSSDKSIRIFQITDREIFSVVDLSQGKGTTDLMKLIEKEFGSDGTTRNWNTVQKILEISEKT